MLLNLQSFHFLKAFGKVKFCGTKGMTPCFDLKIEKKAAEPKKDDGKKKDAPAKDQGKD